MAASRQGREFIMPPRRILVVLASTNTCKEWADPTKIPVDAIVTEWREQSKKGRYEAAMWRDAGLEEPNAKGAKGAKEGANADAEMEVDNLAAGGFFGWMGRDQLGAGRVRAGAYPPPAAQGP